MNANNRKTIRDNYKDHDRIGNTPVDEGYLEFQEEVEAWLENNAPLPTTFDVAHCQPPFFSEFTYNDFAGGVWVKSLSAEFNSRYFSQVHQNAERTSEQIPWKEKYALKDHQKPEKSNRNIIFLTGDNLYDRISWELVDREIYHDDRTLIKPHPLTSDEPLKKVANRYGWHRIIDLNESGYYWYQQASSISTTANSEFFVRSIIDGKIKDCLTKISLIAKASYFPVFHVWKTESNLQLESLILDERSGIVFPEQDDWKDRLSSFFQETMQMRTIFQSHVPLFVGDFQH